MQTACAVVHRTFRKQSPVVYFKDIRGITLFASLTYFFIQCELSNRITSDHQAEYPENHPPYSHRSPRMWKVKSESLEAMEYTCVNGSA